MHKSPAQLGDTWAKVGQEVFAHPLPSLEKTIPACSWVDGMHRKVLLALPFSLDSPQHVVRHNQRKKFPDQGTVRVCDYD